ncbi:hypothetical protein PJW08_07595 [Tenacibaculum finnmarkense]|nr:hypothetical protein PJW08_07595 [Tenacibaculum finnmarkense]
MLFKITKQTLIVFFTMSVCFYVQHVQGQEQVENKTAKKETKIAFGQLDFLDIKMPGNEKNMGFTGIHYNLKINDWSYAGIGIYSAVTGIRGGFFTLGINAWCTAKNHRKTIY